MILDLLTSLAGKECYSSHLFNRFLILGPIYRTDFPSNDISVDSMWCISPERCVKRLVAMMPHMVTHSHTHACSHPDDVITG